MIKRHKRNKTEKRITRCCSRIAVLTLLFLLSLCAASSAQENADFYNRQQVGIRLGGWLNQGGLPVDTFPNLKTDVGNNSFYAELYGAWRVFNRGYLEVSLGFANRGEVSVIADAGTALEAQYFGNLVMYPILLQLKYYLPGFRRAAFKPYFQVGGGLYMGRHSVQFTNLVVSGIQEPSRTKISYVIGGGFDWPLSQSISLDFNSRYFPFEFSEELFTVNDFSAVTVTVGLKYLFVPTKKKHGSRPHH